MEIQSSTNTYVWGNDLSGTLQGAGGVGGLLAVSIDGAYYLPCYDNNGNITAYVNEQGAVVAQYTYDAFGATIAQSGSHASHFPHRFSTKYHDPETGLYYYGCRFYSPLLRRWLNRDPIEEDGGLNLYAFCSNDAVNRWDLLGFCVTVITIGDSLTYGTESRGRTYTGYAKALSIKNACNEAISFGGAGQRIGKIAEGYRDPTTKCDKKVAILAMMGMNDALGLANDRRLPDQQRDDKYKERYDSAIAAWRKLYAGVKGDFDSMVDPKPKVLFVTITIPGIGNTPNLRPEYAGIMQQINGFLNSLNTDMPKACTADGAWWSCATADASRVTHTTGLDAQGNPNGKTSDDGVHFLNTKNKEIAYIVSQVVNAWSGE